MQLLLVGGRGSSGSPAALQRLGEAQPRRDHRRPVPERQVAVDRLAQVRHRPVDVADGQRGDAERVVDRAEAGHGRGWPSSAGGRTGGAVRTPGRPPARCRGGSRPRRRRTSRPASCSTGAARPGPWPRRVASAPVAVRRSPAIAAATATAARTSCRPCSASASAPCSVSIGSSSGSRPWYQRIATSWAPYQAVASASPASSPAFERTRWRAARPVEAARPDGQHHLDRVHDVADREVVLLGQQRPQLGRAAVRRADRRRGTCRRPARADPSAGRCDGPSGPPRRPARRPAPGAVRAQDRADSGGRG